MCSGNKLATVTNTTVEILISEQVFGSVYGKDGANLNSIIQVTTHTKTKRIIVVDCVVFIFYTLSS